MFTFSSFSICFWKEKHAFDFAWRLNFDIVRLGHIIGNQLVIAVISIIILILFLVSERMAAASTKEDKQKEELTRNVNNLVRRCKTDEPGVFRWAKTVGSLICIFFSYLKILWIRNKYFYKMRLIKQCFFIYFFQCLRKNNQYLWKIPFFSSSFFLKFNKNHQKI